MLFSRTAEDFLISHGIHPDQVDMHMLCERFIKEMNAGLRGDSSSLAMLPTFVSVKEEIPADTSVIVLDAGGTNFRSCLVTFDDSLTPQISSYSKNPMPGSRGSMSREAFFRQMAAYTRPLMGASSLIGFCFSYPTENTPQRDGRILHFSKEIQAQEALGELVGASLIEALREYDSEASYRCCILNDTAATLLAGKIAAEKPYSGYIGFILGTGTNTSYVEQCSRIGKTAGIGFQEENQIVNVESGGFAVDLSDLDRKFYETTKNPGTYHFEKIVSGGYLGPYVLHVLSQACAEGIFSEPVCGRLEELKGLSTIEMDDLMHTPEQPSVLHDVCGDNLKDRSLMYQIVDRLIERAARLSAVNLSAAVMKTGAGTDPAHPVCINADGTTFLKTHNLMKYTRAYLDEFLVDQHNRYYDMIHVDNAPVLGAAVAGLQNP